MTFVCRPKISGFAGDLRGSDFHSTVTHALRRGLENDALRASAAPVPAQSKGMYASMALYSEKRCLLPKTLLLLNPIMSRHNARFSGNL
jgi:hypothetical protein